MTKLNQNTINRKRDHVNFTINKNVSFRNKTNGFEKWEFVHNALPEINFSEINCETIFFGKKLSFPLIISSMTGGYNEAEKINKALGTVAEKLKIAIGVGSQRQAIENKKYHNSFKILRDVAPSIPILGNIGAAEIADLKSVEKIKIIADLILADAFIVHLNPLQEFLQPEGNRNFKGVLNGIEKLTKDLNIPIIVKEVGAGISKSVAKKLLDVGVSIIDVAGAGGTSWAGVEILRNEEKKLNSFWDWGIPTADCVVEVSELKNKFKEMQIIASGGVNDGVTMAKSIAIGADYFASARSIIKTFFESGEDGVEKLILQWKEEFLGAMFLTGSKNISDLNRKKIKYIG